MSPLHVKYFSNIGSEWAFYNSPTLPSRQAIWELYLHTLAVGNRYISSVWLAIVGPHVSDGTDSLKQSRGLISPWM
jgi:hypothetical protein